MILLDTHALIWWVSDSQRLSHKAREAIMYEKTNGLLLVSAISIWEIYLLVHKERLTLTMDTDSWLARIEALPFVQFVPIDNKIASKSVILPGEFHSDPADRIIVATAREKGVALVTNDGRISKYAHVQVIW